MAILNAAAVLTGAAAVVFTAEDHRSLHAPLAGAGLFFVDPTKDLLIPYFKATAVPSAYRATGSLPKPAIPGTTPTSTTVGVPIATRNTQTGGIPNQG